MNKIKLGVLFGGMSTEHNVSIVSGTSVIKNLNKEKYDITPIYISKEGQWYIYTKSIEEITFEEIEQITEKKATQEQKGEVIEKGNNLQKASKYIHFSAVYF